MTPFTHIVVGAGSAGCVVAARIAENPAFNVLLLEAGPDCHEPEVAPGSQDVRRVPMKGQSEMFNDRIDWDIRVELPGNDSMRVAQAKVVGGGSSINGGTALRNVVRDCEEWVQLGNDAWGWESVEPVYASLEKDEASSKTGLHPLTRMQPGEAGKIQQAFVADAMQLGLPWVEDLSLSIPVEQDLPVGANLADHPCVPAVARPKPGSYNDSDRSKCRPVGRHRRLKLWIYKSCASTTCTQLLSTLHHTVRGVLAGPLQAMSQALVATSTSRRLVALCTSRVVSGISTPQARL